LIPNDFYGSSVNIASKLAEDVAEPGELLVSKAVAKMLGQSTDPLFSEILLPLLCFTDGEVKIGGAATTAVAAPTSPASPTNVDVALSFAQLMAMDLAATTILQRSPTAVGCTHVLLCFAWGVNEVRVVATNYGRSPP
jgi:hypothetical protein